jgi:hypothetical protein
MHPTSVFTIPTITPLCPSLCRQGTEISRPQFLATIKSERSNTLGLSLLSPQRVPELDWPQATSGLQHDQRHKGMNEYAGGMDD